MGTGVNPDADVAAEIRRLLRPVVASASGEEPSPSSGQKYRLYNRIVQSMQDMYGFLSAADTSGSPLILVIEDLQWADPSTEELFAFLVGEARQNKLMVIGTLTIDPNADGGGTALLAAWEQRGRDANFPVLRVDSL